MEGFPEALVIASQEEVYRDNNVLFRLVRPAPDGFGVQSTDRLVNVVPYRRVYAFERKQEIDTFREELLRRPLVMQPVLHFGRGLVPNCGACYHDESWVVMINQTHPKILSRLQMGFDHAKAGIDKGQSVEIKFCFGDLIQRVYREHLAQKEKGEATSCLGACLASLRFTEWEYGDLVIRYHGYAAKLGRRAGLRELKTLALEWTFDDIGMHEMLWSQLGSEEPHRPHLAPVTEDEIRETLPAWTINKVSPLQSIGDDIPSYAYSYQQAGRLYESFRKKKRQRDDAPTGYPHEDELGPSMYPGTSREEYGPSVCPREVELGAVGGELGLVEHDFSQYNNTEQQPSESRRKYHDDAYSHHDDRPTHDRNQNDDYYRHQNEEFDRYHDYDRLQNHNYNQYQNGDYDRPNVNTSDSYGHLHANVEIVNPPGASQSSHHHTHPNTHTAPNYRQPNHHYPRPPDHNGSISHLKKQDSDRSSRSTNADSGFGPGSEGRHSRDGSYDISDDSHRSRSADAHGQFISDTAPLEDRSPSPLAGVTGVTNAGFKGSEEELDHALRKHKELVHRYGHAPVKGHVSSNIGYTSRSGVNSPPERQGDGHVTRQINEHVADSFI